MPRERADASYLRDMLCDAQATVSFTQGHTFAEYKADLFLRSAVERQIEIIGEAASRLDKDYRLAHPAISWDKIIRQRHVLAHHYGAIEHERLWRVATIHVPVLVDQLAALVPPDPQDTPP